MVGEIDVKDVMERADVVGRFEMAQWPVSLREKIRKLVTAVWAQGYTRGWSECTTTTINDNENGKGTD